jgi:hypothetical protein
MNFFESNPTQNVSWFPNQVKCAEDLELRKGMAVTAIAKSTSVMIQS